MHHYLALLDRAETLAKYTKNDERKHWQSEVSRLTRVIAAMRAV